jgi:hypothetical protein
LREEEKGAGRRALVCSSCQLRVGPGCDDRLRYGAFILDIDGNNLEAVCEPPE